MTSATAAIVLDEVTFRRQDREILRGVSVRVGRGEHWVVLGPNGAGKSTVLGMCGARTFPTSGTIDLLGHRMGRVELQALRRRIGHVDPRLPLRPALTIAQVVFTGLTGNTDLPMRWHPTEVQQQRVAKLIELLGLGGMASARWGDLSQGERGRALIARSLVAEPALMLLDEPSTGLDVAAREQLIDTIDGLARSHADLASVLVTHHLEEVPETTTHALLISHGRVVAAGLVEEVLTTEHVTAAFEHPITVERQDGRWLARTRRALATVAS
ncbi:ABC transporter ATP-binding protein [Citricoccus alkalitolerans]|uniref:ABC transporter ATP-binding protein n=1 Tax=Citricoccus alkalitolerans TaxID=246603 RepID=A0ABV8XUQ8_9MICC